MWDLKYCVRLLYHRYRESELVKGSKGKILFGKCVLNPPGLQTKMFLALYHQVPCSSCINLVIFTPYVRSLIIVSHYFIPLCLPQS
jgi:hypothetical protein